jgi:DNA-binding CsgD family transcriptional regulator
LWRVRGVARLDGVVEHDAVVVVHDLRLVAELDPLAEATFGDRSRVCVVQADPPRGPLGHGTGHALPGLGHELPSCRKWSISQRQRVRRGRPCRHYRVRALHRRSLGSRDASIGCVLCRNTRSRHPASPAPCREYATAGGPLLEAQARERAAERLAADGAHHAARGQLDLATRIYASLEAAWDIARAEGRLGRYGIRRGVRGHRRRPKAGWAALTPTELQIARLVSGGLSNSDIAARTFTCRRTVQFHVSSIVTKLDLASRVELAAGSRGARRTDDVITQAVAPDRGTA